jgi:hypothetical protein
MEQFNNPSTPKEKVWYVPSQAMTITFCVVVLVVSLGGVFWLASKGGSNATPSASPSADPNHLSAFGPSALQNTINAQNQQNAQAVAAEQAQQQIPAGVELPAGPVEPTASASASPIDCVGPDGKHFQAAPTDCDNFKKAWANPTASASASPSESPSPSQSS